MFLSCPWSFSQFFGNRRKGLWGGRISCATVPVLWFITRGNPHSDLEPLRSQTQNYPPAGRGRRSSWTKSTFQRPNINESWRFRLRWLQPKAETTSSFWQWYLHLQHPRWQRRNKSDRRSAAGQRSVTKWFQWFLNYFCWATLWIIGKCLYTPVWVCIFFSCV